MTTPCTVHGRPCGARGCETNHGFTGSCACRKCPSTRRAFEFSSAAVPARRRRDPFLGYRRRSAAEHCMLTRSVPTRKVFPIVRSETKQTLALTPLASHPAACVRVGALRAPRHGACASFSWRAWSCPVGRGPHRRQNAVKFSRDRHDTLKPKPGSCGTTPAKPKINASVSHRVVAVRCVPSVRGMRCKALRGLYMSLCDPMWYPRQLDSLTKEQTRGLTRLRTVSGQAEARACRHHLTPRSSTFVRGPCCSRHCRYPMQVRASMSFSSGRVFALSRCSQLKLEVLYRLRETRRRFSLAPARPSL